MRTELCVVIPMFNEAERIGATLGDASAWLRAWRGASEIVLVDDGSRDSTVTAVAPFLTDERSGSLVRVRLERHPINRGKGAAVRTGLGASEAPWTLIMDADNSARVSEVEKLLDVAKRDGVALPFGSRAVPTSEVEALLTRRASGMIFRTALVALGVRLARDTQCGFKLYRRDAAELMVAEAREDRFAFDIEHLMLANKGGLGTAEVGIRWAHRDGGTVSVLRDGPRMLRAAWRINRRLRAWTPPAPEHPEVITRRERAGAGAAD